MAPGIVDRAYWDTQPPAVESPSHMNSRLHAVTDYQSGGIMRRSVILVVVGGLLVAGLGVLQHTPVASAQEAGWVTLLDGTKLDGWNKVGNASWRIAGGAVESNMGNGFLVSPM